MPSSQPDASDSRVWFGPYPLAGVSTPYMSVSPPSTAIVWPVM